MTTQLPSQPSGVRKIVYSAIFIALGVLIPMIFHIAGGGYLGKTILPMHIPVLLAGFFLPPMYALFVGMITPFLSTLITGMPPAFPMMYIMIFELGAYALVASLLYRWLYRYESLRRSKFHIIFSLLGAMIFGRIIAGLTVWSMIGIHGAVPKTPLMAGSFGFAIGSISGGIIGIVIQFAIIPTLVIILEPIIQKNG
ncbi:MAG: ECF transporter S component [Caldisericia bacterium]|nr:ECF transporter S component [Caldisericia bacterium]